MIQKILNGLQASIRDIVLAGVAAASGFLIGKEIPSTSAELKILLVGAIYAGIRAAVAFAVSLVNRKPDWFGE